VTVLAVFAPVDVRARRLAICEACPDRKKYERIDAYKCGRCGCPITTKVKFARAQCPARKW